MIVRRLRTLLLTGLVTALLAGCQTTLPLEPTSTPFYATTRGIDADDPSFLFYMDEYGVATKVGVIGYALSTIKFNPDDGALYGITRSAGNYFLIEVDLDTGVGTEVVEITGATGPFASMAFDTDGTLYAWTENSDDLAVIDVDTGVATVLGDSGLGTAAHGMWFDDAGTLWFHNYDGYVYTIDTSDGSATLVHELGDWTGEGMELFVDSGNFINRGDLNPDTGEVWGVSPAYGYVIASAVVRTVVDADGAELIGPAPVQSAIAIHILAFPR